jgi:hypothetical protein
MNYVIGVGFIILVFVVIYLLRKSIKDWVGGKQ